MINSKIFLKGLFSIKRLDSPAIALGASFIAIGALLKNVGFKSVERLKRYKIKIEKYDYKIQHSIFIGIK